MRKKLILVCAFLCLALSACGQSAAPAGRQPSAMPAPTPEARPLSAAPTAKPPQFPSPSPSEQPTAEPEAEAAPAPLTNEAEFLVTVTAEDGMAYLEFNPEEWQNRRGLEISEEQLQLFDGLYAVTTSGEGVKEAFVIEMPELDIWKEEEDEPDPIVFLLMEDGSVEFAAADVSAILAPEWTGLHTIGPALLMLPEIEAIHFAPDENTNIQFRNIRVMPISARTDKPR